MKRRLSSWLFVCVLSFCSELNGFIMAFSGAWPLPLLALPTTTMLLLFDLESSVVVVVVGFVSWSVCASSFFDIFFFSLLIIVFQSKVFEWKKKFFSFSNLIFTYCVVKNANFSSLLCYSPKLIFKNIKLNMFFLAFIIFFFSYCFKYIYIFIVL